VPCSKLQAFAVPPPPPNLRVPCSKLQAYAVLGTTSNTWESVWIPVLVLACESARPNRLVAHGGTAVKLTASGPLS
jgi:hypothetical protein